MGKKRKGGFVIQTWIGDHDPYHCHVFADKGFIAKINLENMTVMEGKMNRKLRKILEELLEKGEL